MTRLDRLALGELSGVTRQESQMVEGRQHLERQSLREGLPLFERDQARQSLRLLVDPLAESCEAPGALIERRAAPKLGRERGGFDRVLQLSGVGTRHPCDRLTGRRIDIDRSGAASGSRFPVDPRKEENGIEHDPRTFRAFHVSNIGARNPEARGA
jgi:hypothetical protein